MLQIDPVCYQTRPEQKRLPKEERCYDALEQLEIPFWRVDHGPADTIDLCHAVEQVIGGSICKNLFLCNRQQTAFYLLLMPGDKPFKTKDLSAQIGSARLSFAGAEHMEQYLDITPGSVSILGLLSDHQHTVTLLIDRELMTEPYLYCHPCINTSTLRLSMNDVLQKLLPHTGHHLNIVDLPDRKNETEA